MDRVESLLAEAAPVTGALEAAGHSVVLVGGGVRDALLGRPWREIDLATSAAPEELRPLLAALGRVRDLGFGVVQLRRPGAIYHLARLRQEADYQDRRHPATVHYVNTVQADLARRDYTVNAIALTPEGGWIDPFGGRVDLTAGTLRALPPARARLGEDPLRILRGIRLVSSHRLSAEPATEAALWQPDALSGCPRSRADDELWRLIQGEAAAAAWKHYQPLLRPLWPWAGLPTWQEVPPDPALAVLSLAASGGDLEAGLAWLKGRLGDRRHGRLVQLAALLSSDLPHSAPAERRLASWCTEGELGWLAAVQPERYQGVWQRAQAEGVQRCLALRPSAIARICERPPGPWLGPCQEWLWQRVWQDPALNSPSGLTKALAEWRQSAE